MRNKHTAFTLGLLSASIAFGLAARVHAEPAPATPVSQSQSSSENAQRTKDETDQSTSEGTQRSNERSNPKAELEATTLPVTTVTASRRVESVQDVAGQVTSLTGTFLDNLHAKNFEDFAAFVPGLSYGSLGPTGDIVAIRGVTTGANQLSSGTAVYYDEVSIGASTALGGGFLAVPINTFDLSRVEVLNGPQGTLYGANALGGAIKYIPTPPNLDEFGALGSASLSQTAHAGTNHDVNLMLNQPFVDGKVALRVDVVDQHDSGYGRNTQLGHDNQGAAKTRMGRAQLLAQVTPDLSVKFSAFSQKVDADGALVGFFNSQTSKPIQGPYDQQFFLDQTSSSSLKVYSGIVEWKMPWATLTSITAHQRTNSNNDSDATITTNAIFQGLFGFPASVYSIFANADTTKTTQEFRLESPQGQRFEWLLGLYGAHEKNQQTVDVKNVPDPAGLLLGFSPFYGTGPSVYEEKSLFADGTYHFTDKFDVTLGLRYSHNKQRYDQSTHGWLVVPSDPGLVTGQHATSSESVKTWLFNPRYHVTENFMLYAKAASGYRPGGPNFVLELGQGAPTYAADKLWNYEIGQKSTFLDGRATFNADLYDIRWTGIQLVVNNGGVNQIVNGGDARIKGAEFSAALKATQNLTLTASGASTDAKLSSASPPLGLAQSGARLPFSPKFNAALAATYGFNMGNRTNGQFTLSNTWIGERTAGFKNSLVSPQYRMPSYSITNLDLAIFAPHGIQVDAFVHNVFDKAGQVAAAVNVNPLLPVGVILAQPRTIGLRFTYALGNPY